MTGAEVVAVTSAILPLADHADDSIPDESRLGVAEAEMRRHIALDLGTTDLTRHLAPGLKASANGGGWSRLVVDLDRDEADEAVIPIESDGTFIPGNAALDQAGRSNRIAGYHGPDHDPVRQRIAVLGPRLIVGIRGVTSNLKNAGLRTFNLDLFCIRNKVTSRATPGALADSGWTVGDQESDLGKHLRARRDHYMVPGTPGDGIPSVPIEVRQDHLVQRRRGGASRRHPRARDQPRRELMRRAAPLASLMLLACQAEAPPGDAIACGPVGEPLARTCTLSRVGDVVIVRQADGAFHRLALTPDGVESADGAEAATTAPADGGVDATVGGWTYRLPNVP